jgi:hypothetical protein
MMLRLRGPPAFCVASMPFFFFEVLVERPEFPLSGLPLKVVVEVSVPPCGLNCLTDCLLDAPQLKFEMLLSLADSFEQSPKL